MIKNIRHVGVVVKDMGKSISFYHGLGFKKILEMYEDNPLYGGEIWTVKMKHEKSKILLELIKAKNPIAPMDWHIAVTVDNMPNATNYCQPVYEWKKNVAFARAPEGTMIELVKEE